MPVDAFCFVPEGLDDTLLGIDFDVCILAGLLLPNCGSVSSAVRRLMLIVSSASR